MNYAKKYPKGTSGADKSSLLENSPRVRPIRGIGLTIDLTDTERVRAGWKQWLTDRMPFHQFGTLTLRPLHGKSCDDRFCDGLTRFGTINCRLPGVQKTEKLIATFRKLCSDSFVVEEYGARNGRRHFHYLAVDSETERYEEQYCIREMAGRYHVHHETGFTAVGFWKRFGGNVDNTHIQTYQRAIDYVLKDIHQEENRVWFG